MRVLIASTHVPFVRGGNTKIVDDLHRELTARGFETDVVSVPILSDWRQLAEQTAALRLLDLSESCGAPVDRLVTIRTPAYALRHPNKVAWFIHHHREAYDLWGTKWCGMPDDEAGRHARAMMFRSDELYLREHRRVFTNSKIVAGRLRNFNRLEPDAVLYPPLPGDHPFRPGPFGDYILYASRLAPIKRQMLAIEALAHTHPDVRLVIAGAAEGGRHRTELETRARELDVSERVELTGWVSEVRKAELMAGCCGALYLAFEEDSYGYVTLEAFHSHKPVITLTDSGGSLEVIEDGFNGYVAAPDPAALAEAMDRLWRDRRNGERMGKNAHESIARHRINWDHVIENLTS
jgi:glycosyltransferase involved in cell wall biosynthesis